MTMTTSIANARAQLSALLHAISINQAQFADVLAWIDEHFLTQNVAFSNGDIRNDMHENQGSAKVFALAQRLHLNRLDTLSLFCEHYQAVLDNPHGNNHANIRAFMQYDFAGLSSLDGVLQPR